MNIANMKVDTVLIDATKLDEAEQAKAMELAQTYGDSLQNALMVRGGVSALMFAIGIALRMVKANEGIPTYDLGDLRGVVKGG
jgi:hypothetical protein